MTAERELAAELYLNSSFMEEEFHVPERPVSPGVFRFIMRTGLGITAWGKN